MGSKLKVLEIDSLTGGLNAYSNATQIGDNESPDQVNTYPKGLSAVTKRAGYVKTTTTEILASNAGQGVFSYINSSGTRERLYSVGGNLYKYDGAGGSTLVSSAVFNSSAMVNAAQVGSRLYFFTGVDALKYYDGSSVVTTGITAAPGKPSQGIFFNRRPYTTDEDNKDRVYYGQPLDSAGAATNTGNFTVGADSGYFGFGLGKIVMGFAKIQDSLYVFLEDSIYRIDPVVSSGTLSHSISIISNSIGCRAPRSIENVENDVFFLSSTVQSLGEVGSYVSIRTRNVSARVQSIFNGMNQSDIRMAAAIYYERENAYLIAISRAGTKNDSVLLYSVPYKSWWLWDSMSVSHWLDYVDSSGVQRLHFLSADSTKSYLYEAFQGLTDDGAAITAWHATKEFDLGSFHSEKIFQDWNVQIGGIYGSLTIETWINAVLADSITFNSGVNVNSKDGIGTLPFGTFPIGKEGNFIEASASGATLNNDFRWHTISGDGNGQTIQFVFKNSNPDESFEIKKLSAGYIELPYYARSSDNEV